MSSRSLEAIRRQMAVSLERMRQLEEQVKAIPPLQMRVLILKEEKRQLMEQLKANTPCNRNSESEAHESRDQTMSPAQNQISVGQLSAHRLPLQKPIIGSTDASCSLPGSSAQRGAPPIARKPLRSIGVGEGNVFADATTAEMTTSNGVDDSHAIVRIHDREQKTQQHTELRQLEIRTLFLGGETTLSHPPESAFSVNAGAGRHERPRVPPKPKTTRTARVGTDTDFPSPTNFEVHEKELRTVYIEDSMREARSTRNVGIQCRAAMRDVGVMHLNESERPMTRTIGVSVGEVGARDMGVGRMGVGEMGVGEMGVDVGRFDLAPGSVSTRRLQTTTTTTGSRASWSTSRIHIGDDQLRTVLDGMLRKTVHSVAVQCRFSTVDRGVDATGRYDEASVDVGCSDDSVDVDVTPRRQRRSVAVDHRPSLCHRSSATDAPHTVDAATNTAAPTTPRPTTVDSETNTDDVAPTDVISVSTATDGLSSSLVGDRVRDAETNTEAPQTSSIAVSTLLLGEVEASVPKPPSASMGTNTMASSLSVRDVAINTNIVRETKDKAVATSRVSCQDRSSNTDRLRLTSASTNTEKSSCVSRSTGDMNSIFADKETEFSSCTVETVNGSHRRILLKDVNRRLHDDDDDDDEDGDDDDDYDDDDDADGASRTAEDYEPATSSSFVDRRRELSQCQRVTAEAEEIDYDSGSSSEEAIPDLKQVHDETVRLTVSVKPDSSAADDASDPAIPVPDQSSSADEVAEIGTAEAFGARPRDLSFSLAEANIAMTAAAAAERPMGPTAAVPLASPPTEADERRVSSGDMGDGALLLQLLSPNSDLMWLSASDDSVSTQCSVIDRSGPNGRGRSWTSSRSDETEAEEAVSVARGVEEGPATAGQALQQMKRARDVMEGVASVAEETTEIYNVVGVKKRANWDFCFSEQQRPADGSSMADGEQSELNHLMDCLEITATTTTTTKTSTTNTTKTSTTNTTKTSTTGGGRSACTAADDDDDALEASALTRDDDRRCIGRGRTLSPSTEAVTEEAGTEAGFRPRHRDVADSSLADSFLNDDERCSTWDEWPSGTSVFTSSEILNDDALSSKEPMRISVLDDEDVEFPVALQPRGQGRRIIMTETRTDRQRRRTSKTDDGKCRGEGGAAAEEEGEDEEEAEHGRVQSSASVSFDGTLKSIIKSASSTGCGRTRKEISFLEGIVDSYEPATDENDDSESDGSRSSLSFDEGTYDSRLGQVHYRSCPDDNMDDMDDDRDDAVFDQDDFAFSDRNLRNIYELSEEMVTACTTYSRWVEGEEQLTVDQLNSQLAIIQSEWFYCSSRKLADPSQVEDHLTQINEISRKLLEHIVNMADSNGNTALHYAISHCNMEVVNMILDTGVCDVDKRNRAGYNAIMLASLADVQTQRQRDVIRRLFDMGDVNQRALQAGQTALMLAVSHGDVTVVGMLLEAGAKVNMLDEDGSTALMCASEHGHIDIVKMLLAQDECDASLVDNDGSTAISIAMEAGHREVGILLYAHLNFKPASPMASQRKTKKKTNESSSLTKN